MLPRHVGTCLVLASCLLCGCGLKEKLERQAREKIAEKLLEASGDIEVDLDSENGKVTVKNEDGSVTHIDSDARKVLVTDADGKTHEYVQGEDGSARVTGSDGLDAEMAAKLPADFPLALPPLREVMLGQRVEQPDGSLSFSVTAEATSQDILALAATLAAALESKGLSVKKNEVETQEGKLITLEGKDPEAKIEAGCMLSTSSDDARPGVNLVVTWTDRSAVTAG